jgi:hypothetical protein
MPRDPYRITSSTIALFLEDGRHVAHMVPIGAVVLVDRETFNGDKLVEVLWAEKLVMMFTQDIRTRAEMIGC